jgi:hypothetical protein
MKAVRALAIDGKESAIRAAHQILEDALEDPDLRKIVDEICNDSKINRGQIYYTAFLQGAISTLCAVAQGRIVQSGEQGSKNN